MLGQDAAGQIAPQAAVAVDINLLPFVQFTQPPPQLVQVDVKRVGAEQSLLPDLARRAHIQQDHRAVRRQLRHRVPVVLLHQPRPDILNHIASHIHRILGRAVGGRVGQIQLGELFGGEARSNGGGQHVHALVHPIEPHNLRPKNAAGCGIEEGLDRHVAGAGVVGGVGGGVGHHLVIGHARGPRLFFVQPRGGRCQVKELEHRGAQRPSVGAPPPADVVGGNAPLLVGRAGQRNVAFGSGDKMPHLHRVTHGVDVRGAGAHLPVHRDRPLDAQGQARPAGQLRVGGHADAQQHQVGREPLPALQLYSQPVPLGREAGHPCAQAQLHPLAPEIGVDLRRHVGVQGRQHLRAPLEQGGVHPRVHQVLRHLQADEAAAHHHGPPDGMLVQVGPDAQGVLHRAQGEHTGVVLAGQVGPHGPRPGREEQLVIVEGVGAPILQAADGDGMLLRVKLHRLLPHPHVNSEAVSEALRGL